MKDVLLRKIKSSVRLFFLGLVPSIADVISIKDLSFSALAMPYPRAVQFPESLRRSDKEKKTAYVAPFLH